MSSEAWQKGRIERHGQVLKQMLHRVDQDRMIRDLQDFDRTLAACCMAKNQMARHKGYSPEQIVLGKATRIPGSLTGDETTSAHTLQDDNPETSKFHETLTRRNEARIAFKTLITIKQFEGLCCEDPALFEDLSIQDSRSCTGSVERMSLEVKVAGGMVQRVSFNKRDNPLYG